MTKGSVDTGGVFFEIYFFLLRSEGRFPIISM